MSDSNGPETTGLEIAVIGMACRFPGADSVARFWENLRSGVESITYLTDADLEAAGENPDLMAHPAYVRVARLIEGADLFDAALFGFSPREAELVDPQQRLLLECAYEALEDAAYDTETYPGLVGVFAGSKMAGYIWNIYSNAEVVAAVGDLNAQIATDRDYVSTRISYKLNLGGPSVTVQSACSTSLVAVHLACQALLSGECDMALAGGVSVRSEQRLGYLYREGEILSPDGHCRTFDAGAKGTIFGNGLGMVVLRRLDDALAAGDRIRAVIKGTAVNNDSSAKIGFTAPGADGQERVVRAAQTVADVHPETITMIEAHGTATSVGDPLEVTALARAFRTKTEKRGYCAIGSVKTNIGHLASAAGVAGLIKAVLALENRQIPPSLFFEKPNPQIDFEDGPFYVNTALAPWEPPAGLPRRAGVSAFGIGGTNAHAILEEAPEVEPSGPSRPWQLLVLSARTETALEAMTGNLARHLSELGPDGRDFADAAFSLQVGRRALDVRRFVVARDAADAAAVLSGGAPQRLLTRAPEAERPPVAFLFSGQGSQHARMMADLYREEPVFREELGRASRLLVPHLGLDLLDLLYGERPVEEINQTRFAQPALFAVEHALARQWMAWGVEPQAMLGHSIGEYVAACLAGVFSLEDGLKLVAARGRLMQALPPGAMLTVPLAEADLLPRLGRQLSIAATNAPARTVVSGPEEAVAALEAELAAEGVAVRRLHTSHAFHSQMMEPALAPFLEQVRQVELKAPARPYLSNVSGTWITEAEATDAAYWVTHLRGTVRFAEGLAELFAEPHRILLEVGPGQALTALARQHPARQAGHSVVASCRKPQEEGDDQAVLLGALGQLWLAGAGLSWQGFWEGERRRRAPLPGYAFERRRYWIEAKPDLVAEAPLRNKELSDWFYVPHWKPAPPPVPWSELEAGPAGPWLVFADDLGLGVRLAERLAEGAEGGAVTTVLPGQRFQDHGGGVYEIDPSRPEDYDALLSALAAGPGLPARIAHLLTVTGPLVADEPLLTTSSRLAERGFWSLLHLLQALGRTKVGGAIELTVVSDGLAQVADGEEVHPEKALVMGPVKVASQEYPFLSCRSVDVGFASASQPLEEQVEGLLAELGEPVGEVALAWRGGRRFVLGYQGVRLDRALEGRMPVRDQGVYLITGGLGGIGLVLAEYLACRCRARLVLTSFSALPPREEWESALAALPAGNGKAERIRKVLELEALGAEVMVAQADAADEAATVRVIEEARQRFGVIHGVIHSAGVAGGGIVQTKSREVAARVLDPKVKGTRLLEAALTGPAQRLDFFVLCSSTIALFGNFGQVDYCAANNFLDAFARYHTTRTGVPTVSINWGAWKEVGMAVNAPAPAAAADLVRGVTRRPAPHHPMLDSSAVDASGRAVYGKTWRPGEHWLIDDHRVLDTPTLPGTGYLEMARAAFEAETGLAAAEIRDVFFLGPMMVAEPRESRVTLEKRGDGFSFKVQSRPVGDGEWQDHAMGKVLPASDAGNEHRDLAGLRARLSGEPLAIAQAMMGDREKLVYWGDHWQVVERVHVGEEEALAELAVAPGTAGNEGFGLHPAMLDVATALSGLLAQKSYLPFSYRRLTTAGPLPPRFLAHVRRRPAADEESIVADVTLLGEDGRVLAEVTEFALKKVGQAVGRLQKGTTAGAPKPESPEAAAPAPPPAAAAKPAAGLFAQGGMLNSEGLEAFRRILSRRPGPQVAVSPRDVNAILEQAAKARSKGSLEEMAKAAPKRAAHPRPSLQTAYTAPGNPTEEALAAVWQDVLGIDTVGVHDNFFELGGDSILGIQVLTRAREAGIEMTSNQLFAHQTIHELAAVLGGETAPAGDAPRQAEPAGRAEIDPVLEAQIAGLDIEDVYPLTPLQEGLLFHAAQAPGSGLYIEQIRIPLSGDVDEKALSRAWQLAVDRHPSLRTAFFWEGLEHPVQAVLRQATLPFEIDDWRSLPEAEQRRRGAAWLAEDALRGFPLSQAPLMRLALVRVGESAWQLLWSHHHLILDGWSSPLLMQEIFATYRALRLGKEPQAGPAPRFRPYVEWLAAQDGRRSESFFRALLAGHRRPTPIAADRPAGGVPGTPSDYGRAEAAVSPEVTAALQALARREQLTLNSAVQGLWALLLARAAEESEVVYGVSLSSRPAAVPDVESIVGLFINALPMRVRMAPDAPLSAWLKELHAAQIALLDHAHTPLVTVQSFSEVPRELPLFESVFEFWNFPFRLLAGEEGSLDMDAQDFFYDVATNFPLSLRAVPLGGLQLQLTYDRRRFDTATAEARVSALAAALEAFAARPEATGAEITALLDEKEREARQERAEALTSVAQERLKQIPRRRTAVEPGT